MIEVTVTPEIRNGKDLIVEKQKLQRFYNTTYVIWRKLDEKGLYALE